MYLRFQRNPETVARPWRAGGLSLFGIEVRDELVRRLEVWLLAIKGPLMILAAIAITIAVVIVAILFWRNARTRLDSS